MNASKATLTMVATMMLAACAPDAWQSYKATGFNEYLNTVGAQCQPLWIGQSQLQQVSAESATNMGAGRFDQFLDLTSRLYYNRLSAADYRGAVQQLADATSDPRTNRSIDCIVAKLPPDRPSTPRSGL